MAQIDNDTRLALYRTMVKIRKFEEKVSENFLAGQIPGFIHLSIGQEAVSAGACHALKKDDYILTTHRGHGQCIAKGADIKSMMAEIFGRVTGFCKGKGGSMHLATMDVGILGANGIVGGGIPIAVGAAFSAKYRKSGQVAVSFFGDGATGEGTFHGALNMASIWSLPIIFVCENNGWAEFSPKPIHMDIENVSQRAKAYGNVASEIVDGNDPEAVLAGMERAAARARKGEGPTLLECMTTRFRGHYEGDPQKYRPKEELDALASKDAIPRYRKKLIENKILTEDSAAKIDAEIAALIDETLEYAKNSPLPGIEEALKDVYV